MEHAQYKFQIIIIITRLYMKISNLVVVLVVQSKAAYYSLYQALVCSLQNITPENFRGKKNEVFSISIISPILI